jgi:hypothetical protein
VAISNHRFAFQQWKQGVNPRIRSWIKHSSDWARCQKGHWWYLFHKEVKSWDSTTWFRIWQFRTLASLRYLQTHLLAKRFVFGGWWSGFSERGIQDVSDGTHIASSFAKFIFRLYIYSLWNRSASPRAVDSPTINQVQRASKSAQTSLSLPITICIPPPPRGRGEDVRGGSWRRNSSLCWKWALAAQNSKLPLQQTLKSKRGRMNAAMQVLLWRSRLLVFCLVIIQLGCSWWTGPYGCREFHFWPFFLSSHWKASVDLRIRTLMSVGNIRSSSEWKWNRLKSLIACLRKGPIFAILLVLVPRKRFFF